MFPHWETLLQDKWSGVIQGCDETGVSYRDRFRFLAGNLGIDPEGCKIKFV